MGIPDIHYLIYPIYVKITFSISRKVIAKALQPSAISPYVFKNIFHCFI